MFLRSRSSINNKIISFKKLFQHSQLGAPQKRTGIWRPWARAQCAHWLRRPWSTAQYSHTHTHPFNGPLSGTTQVSQYQKGKTNLDFTEARDSERQWHQPGHMQVCTSLQTDNHANTSLLSFLQAGCPSCRPTNSVKALKANQSTEGKSTIQSYGSISDR